MALVTSRVYVVAVFDAPASAAQLNAARNQAHAALIAGGFAASDDDIQRNTVVMRNNGSMLTDVDVATATVKGLV